MVRQVVRHVEEVELRIAVVVGGVRPGRVEGLQRPEVRPLVDAGEGEGQEVLHNGGTDGEGLEPLLVVGGGASRMGRVRGGSANKKRWAQYV